MLKLSGAQIKCLKAIARHYERNLNYCMIENPTLLVLEREGLLVRSASEDHTFAVFWNLTPKGTAAIEQAS